MKNWYSFNFAPQDIMEKRTFWNAFVVIACLAFYLMYGSLELGLSIQLLTNVWAFGLTVGAIAIRVAISISDKWGNSDKPYVVGLGLIIFLALINIFNVIYSVSMYGLFVHFYFEDVRISLTIIMILIMAIPLLWYSKREIREEISEEWKSFRSIEKGVAIRFVAFILIFIGIPIAIFWILYVNMAILQPLADMWSGSGGYSTFSLELVYWVIVIISSMILLFLIVGLLAFRPLGGLGGGFKQISDFDKMGTFITLIFFCVVAPILLIIYVLPELVNIDSGLLGGELGVVYLAQETTNYFSYVFYVLLQSPAPALMIGFMVFGAMTVMISQNIGGVGKVIGGFATGVVVIIPMLFIITIFTGGIPAPDLLIDILGVGVAQVVFGLAETSAFILMLSIIAVFISAGRLLGSMSGQD